jgi:hypothetical protein
MTETIEVVPDRIDQQQLAQQLVDADRAEGVELVGPGGLLTGLTKTVLETVRLRVLGDPALDSGVRAAILRVQPLQALSSPQRSQGIRGRVVVSPQ